MMTANEIRDSFKKFFESKQHAIVPSAPMVIKDDPTLMFTNAGMNQWKDIILGTRDPERRKSVTTPITTPCSRCSATGRLATTSRRVPSIWRGSIWWMC